MRSDHKWLTGALFCLALAAPGISAHAQSDMESTTFGREDWTRPEMVAEVKRYKFHGIQNDGETEPAPADIAVLSGFLQTGQDWPDLETADDLKLDPFIARRDQIVEFLTTLSSVKLSLLADHVEVLRTERIGDWQCVTGVACYPKGFVIAAVGLEKDDATALCKLFYANHWFCAIKDED